MKNRILHVDKQTVGRLILSKSSIDCVDIINKIRPYRYISFDVFDTLLKRDVANPEDVFDLVSLAYYRSTGEKISNFKRKRINAQIKARENSMAKYGALREISLEDIYANMECSGDVVKKLMKIETETEISLACQNARLKPVVDYCIKSGKKVAFISNMYLPKEVLELILNKCGFANYTLWLSSESGYMKQGGELFGLALKDSGASSKEWVHIGDSIKADYFGAGAAKIKCMLIPRHVGVATRAFTNYQKSSNDYFVSKQLLAFLNNRLVQTRGKIQKDVSGSYYDFGFAKLGPLIYGFSRWLHDSLVRDGFDKVFFFSREGEFIKRIFDLLYDDIETRYLYVSRRALRIPYIHTAPDLANLISVIHKSATTSAANFVDSLGLDALEYKEIISQANLNFDTRVSTRSLAKDHRFVKLYELALPNALEKSKHQYEILKKYLEMEGFSGRVACVDIGWSGTMQYFLQSCFQSNDIYGYYFGLYKPRKNIKHITAFLDTANKLYGNSIISSISLIELLFVNGEGSTAEYKLTIPEGIANDSEDERLPHNVEKVVPVLSPYEYKQNEVHALRLCQAAAMQFAEEMNDSCLALLDFSPAISVGNFTHVVGGPKITTVNIFGDFPFWDSGEIFYLAKPANLSTYLTNPKRFIRDFITARWKAGFLMRFIKLPMPYAKLLMLLKGLI